jgi:glycosyltransferase involved in cell wall biosynthesis
VISTRRPIDDLMHDEVDQVRASVALVTNFIPPHQLEVYSALTRRVRSLVILVSTRMEANRSWRPDWGDLDVRVQHTWTFPHGYRHPVGFGGTTYVHVPWDTIPLLRQVRPDVILSSELGIRSFFAAQYRRWSRSTGLVLTVGISEHTERARGWTRKLLRRWLIRRADCLTANSASGMQYLQRRGAAPGRTFLVPYAAVPASLYRGPLHRDPAAARRLICVGRWIEGKGLLPFLQVLARWAADHPARRVELQLVGSGPLRPRLEAFSMPANVSLELLGQRDFAELAGLYASAGILVFPTLGDEWGLVVNEGMTAGLPVLGSLYSQAVRELCTDGKTGWTFRPDVPAEMLRALDRAMNTPLDELDAMRRAARARVEHITPQYAAAQFARAIRAAAALRRSRRSGSGRGVPAVASPLPGAQP